MRAFPASLLSALLLLLAVSPAGSPPAADTASPDCAPPRVVDLCVELDASRSVDPDSGPLTYRWDMGDGTRLTGLKIEHCYKARKLYTVRLDVIEERTGEVRPEQKLIPVDFTREDVVTFNLPTDTVHVGQAVTFDAAESQLPQCENVVVLWDFRDGYVTNGRRVQHAFRRPGQYEIRMSLRANGPDPCPFSHCVSRLLIVQP
jgi:hypothetical protein